MKFKEFLVEAKKSKNVFGKDKTFSYAVNIPELDSNDFFTKNFGGQLSDLKKIGEWKKTAKTGSVGSKGKATLPSVKKWVKEMQVKEFYAKWKSDSSQYKDDSVEIFYKK